MPPSIPECWRTHFGAESNMRIVMLILSLLRAWAARLGPYVILEILLPGGTLFALLLYLYHRRTLARTDARRAAVAAASA